MKMLRPLSLLLLALLSLSVLNGLAQASTRGPGEVVEVTSEKMLETLRANRAMLKKHPDAIIDLVDEIVVPEFDFVRISALVLGKHWRRITPEQRGRFIKEFQSLMVNTYASALLEYSDYKISYAPVHMAEGDRIVMVRTDVERVGADSINMDYRMYNGKKGWKVIDILVDNVSLIANYRNSYGTEVSETGIEALISRLAKHNAEREKKK